MQQWLDLIPIVGTLLTLTADIISLATALIVRRDAQARETTPSHPRALEYVIRAEPGEAAPTAEHDGRPAHRLDEHHVSGGHPRRSPPRQVPR